MNTILRRILAATAGVVMTLTLAGGAVAKHDLKIELFYNGVWNDHTADTYTRDSIEIVHGVADEARGLRPSQATLTFTTRNGARLNPANVHSDLHGKIGRGTLIRITIDGSVEFSGRTYSWKPRRAIKGDSWVHVQAGGVLQQLGEGRDPLRDSAYRYIIRQNPHAFWPLTEGGTSTSSKAATSGTSPMTLSYDYDGATRQFGNGDLAPWLSKGLRVTGVVTMRGPVTATSTSLAAVDVARRSEFPSGSLVNSTIRIHDAATLSGNTFQYYIFMNWNAGSPHVDIVARDQNNNITTLATTSVASIASAPWDNELHAWRLLIVQDGADVDLTVYLDGTSVLSATHSGATMRAATAITLQLFAGTSTREPTMWGDAVFWDGTAPAASNVSDAVFGHRREPAGDRFTRLCGEEGITSYVVGTASDTRLMGPQYPDTMLNLLSEIARTDNALIFDTRAQLGLTMRTGRSLYNQ